LSEGTRAKKGARKKKQAAAAAGSEGHPFAELPFEAALTRLEGLVDRLEEGDLDLAEALSNFEEGVQLTKHCAAQLEAAERRIEILTRDGGDWATRPFSAGPADAAGDASDESGSADDAGLGEEDDT
jgi:exodeoxyribonuclease VII small subunit